MLVAYDFRDEQRMINLDRETIVQQINKITKRPFDFWLVNCQMDYRNLLVFLEKADLPDGAEIFTSECVYPGVELSEVLDMTFAGYCGSAPPEEVDIVRERHLQIEYAKKLQSFIKFAQPAKTAIEKIVEHTRRKKIRLWLGTPYFEYYSTRPRLYNAYTLIENGKILFVHRKKFLWNGDGSLEVGVFENVGTDGRRAPISVFDYDGIFENRAMLICQEAIAFYCPKWVKKPTHIPEVRNVKPDFVIIPANWRNKRRGTEEKTLKRIATAIARRIRDPIDKFSAVRENGSLICVINYNSAYICGPVDEKKIKARVYAQQPNRGWLRITNQGITSGEF